MKTVRISYNYEPPEHDDLFVRAHLVEQADKKIRIITRTFETFTEMKLDPDSYEVRLGDECLEITFTKLSDALLFKLTFRSV